MSVKLITSDTIRADLQALALTWPDGIPPEQVDRVNALRGELKRRGEDPNVAASIPTSAALTAQLPIGQMRQDDLERELRDLSDRLGKKPDDEAAQNRFADVRFELRRRAKSSPLAETATMPPPPPTPRALELPEDANDLVNVKTMKKVEPSSQSQRYGDVDKFSSPGKVDPTAVEELARRTAEIDVKIKKVASPMGGFSAVAVVGAGKIPLVAIEYERQRLDEVVCIMRHLTTSEARTLARQILTVVAGIEGTNEYDTKND